MLLDEHLFPLNCICSSLASDVQYACSITVYQGFHISSSSSLSLSPPASVCFVVCLLSLAWALVLYARACSLIRPGHLQMTPAAILCRLLWRVGMFKPANMYNIHSRYSSIGVTGICSLSAGQHVGISICRSHALHTDLQTMDPGSHW